MSIGGNQPDAFPDLHIHLRTRDFGKNFLDISKKLLKMSGNFLDISRKFPEFSRTFLEMSNNFV